MKRGHVIAGVLLILAGLVTWFFALRHDGALLEEPQLDALALTDASTKPPPVRIVTSGDASITLDRAKRDALREAIYRAWGSAPPDEHTSPLSWPTGPADASGFGADYIQDRIHTDFMPLAKDCYEQGLKKNPKLAGKLVADFRIVGTKNTGGLIDWVDTANEETTLDDKDVTECLTQSLYSVTFDAPPNDGVVTVTYPVTFSPDDAD